MIYLALAALVLAYLIALLGSWLTQRHDDAEEFRRTLAARSTPPADCQDVLDGDGCVRQS